MIDLSIVVPVYRGEKTIRPLFQELSEALIGKVSFEVIFVHDCGPDNSWQVIRELKDSNPQVVKAIQLTRNFGQHNALLCGFERTQGRFVVTMDEDLQHAPADIHALLLKQQQGAYDVVYGKSATFEHNKLRNITSAILKRILRIGIPDLSTDYSAFRLIKGSIARQIIHMQNSYTFLDGYLAWTTTHVGSCEVMHRKRLAGESSYSLIKLIEHSINILITFSNLPMRLLTAMSMFVFLCTFSYSGYLLIRKIFLNDFIPGFASQMIVTGFGVGLILFSIGILGEYIQRINMKATKRPNYVVREEL